MCYNVAYLERRGEKYAERYKDIVEARWKDKEINLHYPNFYFASGFTHPKLPIVRHDGIYLHEWGLIPTWVKEEKQATELQNKTLNAVGETVFVKPSFRSSIKTKRGILGVSGFYEWRDFKGKKYPYYIKVKDDEFTSLGVIYETWVNKVTAEIHDTFSIITTAANPMMEKIHNLKKRMPLILNRKNEAKWVDPELPIENVKKLIVPFDEKKMDAYTVSNMVNSARNNRNVPEAIIKVEYSELETV